MEEQEISCWLLSVQLLSWAHAEISKESLDIWREWHSSYDSDLDVLSELIRLDPQFWCPNSSFSLQLWIDIYI